MTPEQEQKLNKALELLESMQLARDVVFSESIKKNVLDETLQADTEPFTATTSNINQSIGGTSAFTSPKQFDKVQEITIDGANYKIGLYNV